ncbi:MAG TPA: isoaspartyl peptidase/L-asparaginase [Ignavibacteriales bacterium]|nr:isoaspartyl peptidase/L-asparaginase [Ignavibacteriales bacterium]
MFRSLVVILFLFSFTFITAQNKYVLVIHGGAGTIVKGMMTQAEEDSIRAKLKEALTAGSNVLKNNGSSLDAVTAAINVMEDSPLFNAGKGAVFNSKGQNEMDAAIMDGKNLMAGAVAGVHHIKNPINLARLVMDKSPHVMMTGDGAEEFARSQGVQMMPESYFYNQKRYDQLMKVKEKEKQDSLSGHKLGVHEKVVNDYKFGTVGCAALDHSGNLAAGTSTGGMTNKKFGRVGDSPIIGAGTYANNKTCAVSATGYGEYFIRNVVSYDISALMEYKGMKLQDAADFVINKKLRDMGGDGGVIALDRQGNIAMPFNTEGMYRGYVKEDGTIDIEIYK